MKMNKLFSILLVRALSVVEIGQRVFRPLNSQITFLFKIKSNSQIPALECLFAKRYLPDDEAAVLLLRPYLFIFRFVCDVIIFNHSRQPLPSKMHT